jgi:hypothetical protein
MTITVKKISIWRTETEDHPGTLARVLEPLAAAGASLQVVMGYHTGGGGKAAIEVYPISGKKLTAAAQSVGLSPVSIPTLLIEGDDRPGMGHAIGKALGDAGINISFLVTQVTGKRKFSAVFGFPAGTDAAKATALIRKAAAPPPRARARKKR